MSHRRRLSKASLGTLREGGDIFKRSVLKTPNIPTFQLVAALGWSCTHRVTEVFPIGALARKSLAMGLTHRTSTRTGDRKLRCSRNLQERSGQWKTQRRSLGVDAALFTGRVAGPSSSSPRPGGSGPIAGRGRPGGTPRRRRRQPGPASPSV